MAFTREDYYATVRCYADELVSDCRNGRIRSAEVLREAAEYVVGEADWIIYGPSALAVLTYSEHPGAAEDALGWEGLRDGSGDFLELVQRKAHYAMLADVEAAIAAAPGFDADDDTSWCAETPDASA